MWRPAARLPLAVRHVLAPLLPLARRAPPHFRLVKRRVGAAPLRLFHPRASRNVARVLLCIVVRCVGFTPKGRAHVPFVGFRAPLVFVVPVLLLERARLGQQLFWFVVPPLWPVL